jgi:hypothetical protein
MVDWHRCWNLVIKLYRFFTFSLPILILLLIKQESAWRVARIGVFWRVLARIGVGFGRAPGSGFNAKAQSKLEARSSKFEV